MSDTLQLIHNIIFWITGPLLRSVTHAGCWFTTSSQRWMGLSQVFSHQSKKNQKKTILYWPVFMHGDTVMLKQESLILSLYHGCPVYAQVSSLLQWVISFGRFALRTAAVIIKAVLWSFLEAYSQYHPFNTLGTESLVPLEFLLRVHHVTSGLLIRYLNLHLDFSEALLWLCVCRVSLLKERKN